MATPYIVQSLPIKNNDYELCGAVESDSLSSCSSGSRACRYETPCWCSKCRIESDKVIIRRSRSPSSLRSPSARRRELYSDNMPCSFSSLVDHCESQSYLMPVVSESAQNVFNPRRQCFTQRSEVQSPRKNSENNDLLPVVLPREIRGVHDKYVREVEVLKGKIQELRENLQKQLCEQTAENSLSNQPPLSWNNDLDVIEKFCGEPNRSHETQKGEPFEPWERKRIRKAVKSDQEVVVDAMEELQKPEEFYDPSFLDISDASKATKAYLISAGERKRIGLYHGKHNVRSSLTTTKSGGSRFSTASEIIAPNQFNSKLLVTGALSENLHPGLRPSLFPHVPPYIKFATYYQKAEKRLPSEVTRMLRWKITNITPLVVRRTVVHSGFKLVKQSPEWTGTWGKHMRSAMFRTIRDDQKINHFPGTFQIGRKDKLWKNLHRMMGTYSKSEFGFIPRTYILPQESRMLKVAWERGGGSDSAWIVKPPASSRGTGIKVVNKWSHVPKKCPLIVQKYIANPYLINGNKFDLRMYILVTSIDPLRLYLYTNGLVRFASAKYSGDLGSLNDRYMHLTNYSINKLSTSYLVNDDVNACQGHKWSIKSLWAYFEKEGVVDVKALWESLADLVVKTLICGENSISYLSRTNQTSRYCCFELFGVDVLLDHNLRPWLLEVNISPSLHSASPLDIAVKAPLVHDILNMANFHIPDQLNDAQKSELGPKLGIPDGKPVVYDSTIYIAGLSPTERAKQDKFQQMERSQYLEEILSDLTPDDVRHLLAYEDEITQVGSFEKVFPTPETHEYLKYFEGPQYYNKLFDAWENRYGGTDRRLGINLLRSLCEMGIHLDKTDVVPHVSYCRSDELVESEQDLDSVPPKSSPSDDSSRPKSAGGWSARKLLSPSVNDELKEGGAKQPAWSIRSNTEKTAGAGTVASSAIAHILSKLSPEDNSKPPNSENADSCSASTPAEKQSKHRRKPKLALPIRSSLRFRPMRSRRSKSSS